MRVWKLIFSLQTFPIFFNSWYIVDSGVLNSFVNSRLLYSGFFPRMTLQIHHQSLKIFSCLGQTSNDLIPEQQQQKISLSASYNSLPISTRHYPM